MTKKMECFRLNANISARLSYLKLATRMTKLGIVERAIYAWQASYDMVVSFEGRLPATGYNVMPTEDFDLKGLIEAYLETVNLAYYMVEDEVNFSTTDRIFPEHGEQHWCYTRSTCELKRLR